MRAQRKETGRNTEKKWARMLLAATLLAVAGGMASFSLLTTAVAEPSVKVYKNASCGCCTKWADYLQQQGFPTDVEVVNNLNEIKRNQGVPANMASCHTAMVEGYFIEGHVPVEDIRRLLQEKPDIAGLTVPGMPLGSPGMEVPGRPPMAYKVYAIDRDGGSSVYAEH